MIKRCCLITTLLLLAACSSNPNEHKPSPLPILPAKVEQVSLNKLQSWTVGKGFNKPNEVVARLARQNDTVYAASHDGTVLAIEGVAKVRWQQKTKLAITGGLSAAYGRVVTATANAEVLSLDAATGTVQWQKTLLAPVLAAVAQTDERVIVQSNDGKVYGLEAATGNTVWVYDTPAPVLSLRGYASPVVVEDLVVISTATGKLVALAAQTGIPQWEVRIANSNGRSELERMIDIDGDMLLSADEILYVASYQGQVVAVDVAEAKPILQWQQTLSSYRALSAGVEHVYAVDDSSHIVALDKTTGKVVWKQQDFAWRGLSHSVTANNYLFVGDKDGYVHIMAQSDGKLLGRFKVKGAVVDLLVNNNQLWVYTQQGQLRAYALPSN